MQPLPLEVHRPGSQGLRLGELGQVGNREAGVVEKVGEGFDPGRHGPAGGEEQEGAEETQHFCGRGAGVAAESFSKGGGEESWNIITGFVFSK